MTSQDSMASGDYFDYAFLKDKLKRIDHLEEKLANAKENDAQQTARMELCENYSNCFLGNPKFSLRNSLHDRFWRNCFYVKIGADRKEIGRRKRNKSPGLEASVERFHRFLDEAINLFTYLIDRYVSLLAEARPYQSQSDDAVSMELNEDGKIAVVTVLHKFEIFVGDLFRYKEQDNLAANHYERASLLAPGQGNPYNQMAVLEQLKESYCNALYWYARSVKASSSSFETSISNVERLYQLNRKWLAQNVTPAAANAHGIPTKKAAAELVRARKSAASKRFTASFVDLQYQLCSPHPTEEAKQGILQSINEVVTSLEGLLLVNGLGDTLLCRMVVINAYSASQCTGSDLGKVAAVRFGAAFAERVRQHVDKIVENGPRERPPSIRGLAPLLLTCDFASQFSSDGSHLGEAERLFWPSVCHAANKATQLVDCFQLKDVGSTPPKEYKDLVGFTPFESFIDKPDDYLSSDDAKLVAPLLQDASSKRLSQDSASSPFETRLKLAKLLSIMEMSRKVAQDLDGTFRYFEEGEPGEVFEDDALSAAAVDLPFDDVIEDDPNMLVYKAPEHGTGPALLVPGALLLNKAAKSTPEHTSGSLESLSDPTDEPKANGHHRPMSPIPLGFPLPPANALVFPTPMSSASPVAPAPSPMMPLPTPIMPLPTPIMPLPTPIMPLPTPVAQPPMMLGAAAATPAAPPGLRPPPGLMPPPGFAPSTQNSGPKAPQQPPPAWDFLSQQPTANPFFRPPTTYPETGVMSQGPSDPNAFLDQDNPGGLLDSSLLQSLFLDDTNKPLSKNPFLTEYK